MLKNIGVMVGSMLLLNATAWGGDKGGAATFDLATFTGIRLETPATVNVRIGSVQHVSIEADAAILDKIKLKVQRETLVIKRQQWGILSSDIVIDITVPSLKYAAISGAGTFIINGLNEESFEARISGSGAITAQGTAKESAVFISGAGNVLFNELISKRASVNISGSGSVSLTVEDTLKNRISGSGTIRYKGQPMLDNHVLGSGTIAEL
ncbi:head GIN domain-containing protein [Teredinibacter purpureus]|uniref:head GIN domain-containing protein n=1 Tax=Teredinibacter purpureus TaxID=2731756 RepID=UPI0006960FF5|nr:head GIN domain-containing protein [Teredinibacter purpureus]